jgi:tyrosine-protein kinase
MSRRTRALRSQQDSGPKLAVHRQEARHGLPPPAVEDADPVEMGRYVDAFRRSRLLIAFIVVPLTLGVYFVSASLPNHYRATAKLVLDGGSDPLDNRDVQSTERRLATIQTLLTTRETLGGAASRLRGQTAKTLDDKVQATVSQTADVIDVTATDDTPRGAAAIANGVASTYLARQRRLDRERLQRERASLNRDLGAQRNRRGVAAEEERASIRDRLRDLNLAAAGSGSELQLAEKALPPDEPYSPRPTRNALFALFASFFIAALVVVARAQLKPRVSGSRELSRLLDAPILGEIPYVRRLLGRERKTLNPVEYEAYQTLQASLRRHLPPTRQRIVLVTSALHGEGKTEATAALGLVLSQAGLRTWLVSADMRSPRLHELFDVAQAPGLAEVLANGGQSQNGASITPGGGPSLSRERGAGALHVLASGRTPADPAQLLASDAVDGFFDEIGRSDYDYVLLDGPPLLGLVDSQVLAQRVDAVLLVCRAPRLTPEIVLDVRETLERLKVAPLGLVVIGARGTPQAYLQS